MIAVLLFGFNVMAQNPKADKKEHKKEMRQKMKDLTPEQVAALRTKQMTLQLDLTEAQQLQIEKMELERAKKRKEKFDSQKKRSDLTSDELAAKKMEMLDDQIEAKKMLKSILTEEQFQKWENNVQKKRAHKKRKHIKNERGPN
jgi:hypothetical protein